MRLLFISLFSLFITSGLNAQSQNSRDPEAEFYLDKLAEIFKAENTYQVEFKYEVISRIEESKVSDFGSVIVKGDKYKLKTEDTEVIFNGEKIWSYSVPSGEVYVSEPVTGNSNQMLTDPFRLLQNYKSEFKYQLKEEVIQKGRNYVQIHLYPEKLESDYSILKILIDKATTKPWSFTLQQKNGYDIVVTINEIINGLNINDSIFEWDAAANPDVLVIEM